MTIYLNIYLSTHRQGDGTVKFFLTLPNGARLTKVVPEENFDKQLKAILDILRNEDPDVAIAAYKATN